MRTAGADARNLSLVPIQPIGTSPVFYCAAGMGGNPLNLRALALEMGIDQPFYGLQPQGLDGVSKLQHSIPEEELWSFASLSTFFENSSMAEIPKEALDVATSSKKAMLRSLSLPRDGSQ
jgi:hypothetical protein